MQQSFDTIYLDASSESWEQSTESARPGASFGDLLDIYGNQTHPTPSRTDESAWATTPAVAQKPR